MEIWSEEKLRVCTIIQYNSNTDKFSNLPISYGLSIEKCYDGEHYIVIAFVYSNGDSYRYESIGTRIEDECKTWKETKLFRKALKVAFEAIQVAINEEEKVNGENQ